MKNKGFAGITAFAITLTMVSSSCGLSNIFHMTFTDTPTPTTTYTPNPTITFTPSPTPTPTQSSTPTPLPTGVSIETQSNGSTQFRDHDAGYWFTIPEKWIPVTIELDGIDTAIKALGEDNPYLIALATNQSDLKQEGYRLFMFDPRPGHTQKGFTSNISIRIFTDADSRSGSPNQIADSWLKDLKKNDPGLKVDVLHTMQNGGVATWLEFDKSITPLGKSQRLVIHETYLIFQAWRALVIINLSTPKDISSVVDADLDALFRGMHGVRP